MSEERDTTGWTSSAIRALRGELGLKRRQFVELFSAGVRPSVMTLWRWERGKCRPMRCFEAELSRIAMEHMSGEMLVETADGGNGVRP